MIYTTRTASESREDQHRAWAAGVEAFADFVQKAISGTADAVGNVDPDHEWTNDDVARFLTLKGRNWLQGGVPYVLDHNPFAPPDEMFKPSGMKRFFSTPRVGKSGTPTETG